MKGAHADILLKIERAQWWALSNHPFYGSLSIRLSTVIDESPTACTDGKRIRWGATFAAALTDEETRFILLHETMHCAHGHLWRLPANGKANQACDYVVNRTLESVPGIKMPEGGLLCKEFDGLAEEEIYHRLPDAHKGGEGQGQDGCERVPGDSCGRFEEPAEDAQDGDGQSLKDQWEQAVIQAAQIAEATRGAVPTDMQRILDKMRVRNIDWKQEMSAFVKDALSMRNDWSRPARRHSWQPVIYPRRKANDIGLVVFGLDTSGSIDNATRAEFAAHGGQAVADVGCRAVALDCDAAIQAEHWLAPGDEFPLEAKGGGGTDYCPIFRRALQLAEEGERIAGIVVLGDLDGTMPDDPGIPTLWISTTDRMGPFGHTVKMRKGGGE